MVSCNWIHVYIRFVGWCVYSFVNFSVWLNELVLCSFDFRIFNVRYCCQSNTECAQSSESNAAIQRGYKIHKSLFLSPSCVCVCVKIYDTYNTSFSFLLNLLWLRPLTSLFIHKIFLYRAKSNNSSDVGDDDHYEKMNIHAYNQIISTRRHRLKL